VRHNAVVVTGGAGFIGSHVVELLLRGGWAVTIIDNLSAGSRRNVKPLLRHRRCTLEVGDVRQPRFVERVLRRRDPSVVVHLAALHFIPYCVQHPDRTLSVNVLGTQAVIKAAAEASVARVVVASTADVYAPSARAHRETDRLVPLNVYGVSKMFAEQLVAAAARAGPRGVFRIARLFNTFGPRQARPHLIPHIMAEARRRSVIALGNVTPRRDFVYVADVARALCRLAEQPARAGLEIFNVGSGEGRTVREVVDRLGDVIGRPLIVRQDAARVRRVERPSLVADIRRIHRMIGWSPRTRFDDGLAATWRANVG
jgi:UDP-glucose 4-epimerase